MSSSSSDHQILRSSWKINAHQTQLSEFQKPIPNSRDPAPVAEKRSYFCQHLSELRLQLGQNPFRNLHDCLRVRPFGRASIRVGEIIRCGACSRAPPCLYACVSCAALVCRAHAVLHAAETSHQVVVDVDRAELFCCTCRDQLYDQDFDAAVVAASVVVVPFPKPENLRKRRRVDYKPWTPDFREQALIEENSSSLPFSQFPWGLRGLSNHGNTCFMNSVLQALLHTPPLRNYFLSDKHNRFYCERENRTIATRKLCLACDLDAIFSAAFSGDLKPYSPAKFLYSWWQHASNLASYEQQDAHEFFISMLDGIHEKMQKDKRKHHTQGSWSRFSHCFRH